MADVVSAPGAGGLPLSAESVFGVMVAAEVEAADVLFTIAARKAAVFGEGGGNEIGPPPRGVKPVLKLDRSGVKPVRKELGSKFAD